VSLTSGSSCPNSPNLGPLDREAEGNTILRNALKDRPSTQHHISLDFNPLPP
jgi:hypothetical protein